MRTLSILLVDDDKILLNDLKKMINWEEQGFQVLSAANGVQALALFKKHHPDIILTDIMMPGMNGLDLLQNIKSINSYTSVILLSSYDDFSYAKKGLQLGAEDYVLKNELTPEYLYEKLSAVRSHLSQKYHHYFHILAELLQKYFRSSEEISEAFLSYKASLKNFFVSEHYYVLIDYPAPLFHPSSKELLAAELLTTPQKRLSDLFFIESAAEISDHHILLPLNLNKDASGLQTHDALIALCRRIIAMNEDLCSNANLKMLYVPVPQTIEALRDKMKNLSIHERWLSASSIDRGILNLDSLSADRPVNTVLTPEQLREAALLTDTNQRSEQKDLFMKALQTLNGFRPYPDFEHSVYAAILAKCDSLAVPHPQPPYVCTYAALLDWMFQTLDSLSEQSHQNRDGFSEPIREAIHYISEHFGDPDLSVDDISKHVHLSGSYLCTLFKTETHKKLTSFITETRIHHAMTLLRTTSEPINKIALQCGYSSSQYFSSAFQKQTGMTPKEYRRQ